jgi:hypothetical protein
MDLNKKTIALHAWQKFTVPLPFVFFYLHYHGVSMKIQWMLSVALENNPILSCFSIDYRAEVAVPDVSIFVGDIYLEDYSLTLPETVEGGVFCNDFLGNNGWF